MDDLLAEARSVLPLRPGPAEALAAQAKGALLIDIRSDDQRRASGLIPGALVLPRNSLEWRCRRGLPPRLRQVPRGTLARMAIDRWAARGPRQVVAAAIEHARLTHFQLHRAGRDMHTLNRQAARCYASLAMAASPSWTRRDRPATDRRARSPERPDQASGTSADACRAGSEPASPALGP